MTYADFVARTASQLGMTNVGARKILDHVFSDISDLLADGEVVRVAGFGAFHAETRASRMGRNPANGDQVLIPDQQVAKFKPSVKMKRKLNR